MNFNRVAQWGVKVSLAFWFLLAGGCKVMDRSMFAPRTGEIFQTTRMGPGIGAAGYGLLLGMGIWGAQKSGTEWMLPLAIVGLPIAVAGFVVDEGVVSPLTDLVCLPYDLCQPNHGFYIRIVDEYGKPVPGAKISGRILLYSFFDDIVFESETDAAGEFYINKLKNVNGYCWAKDTPGHTPWHHCRDFKVENAKPDSDGRIVFQFVQAKANPGGWQTKQGLTREKVRALLPGKWSADPESRRWLLDGFNCPYANATDRHCFTLDASGQVSTRVPSGYKFYFGKSSDNAWKCGSDFTVWKLVEKGEEKKRSYDSPPAAGWQWGVRLSQVRERNRSPLGDVYYLGEDEKGIYLSPGPFDHMTKNAVVLKYRKAEN